MYQALYRKWRPQTFEDVVGQEHITQTLRTQVETQRLSHAYLFTGTRGTGKTTCAKILAKAVNCLNPDHGDPCNACAACRGIDDGTILDVVELDAASNNGVDQVRSLRDEAVYSPADVRRRVYIVDEVHMLTNAAFNALLKILEEPPEHLMFILATTELHKVPATILSRCQRFSFQRITPPDIQRRLSHVAGAEGIDLTDDAAALLARLADGALRDALSLLDQCAAPGGQINRESVLDTLGLAGNLRTAHLMNHIRRGNTAGALEEFGSLYAAGKGVSGLLGELAALVRDLLIRKTAPAGGSALMAGGYDQETLDTLSKGLTSQRMVQMLELLQSAQSRMRSSANQRTDAELCLIRLCDPALDTSSEGLSARIAQLEAALAGGAALSPPPVGEAPSAPPVMEQPPWEQPQPVPAPPPPVPAAPAQAAQSVPSDRGQFWRGLLPALRGQLKPWAYLPLADSKNVEGRLEHDTLVLYSPDPFAQRTVGRAEILETVARIASVKAGRSITAVAKLGSPPAQAAPPPPSPGAADPFDELVERTRALGGTVQE